MYPFQMFDGPLNEKGFYQSFSFAVNENIKGYNINWTRMTQERQDNYFKNNTNNFCTIQGRSYVNNFVANQKSPLFVSKAFYTLTFYHYIAIRKDNLAFKKAFMLKERPNTIDINKLSNQLNFKTAWMPKADWIPSILRKAQEESRIPHQFIYSGVIPLFRMLNAKRIDFYYDIAMVFDYRISNSKDVHDYINSKYSELFQNIASYPTTLNKESTPVFFVCTQKLRKYIEKVNLFIDQLRKKTNEQYIDFLTKQTLPIFKEKEQSRQRAIDLFAQHIDEVKRGDFDYKSDKNKAND